MGLGLCFVMLKFVPWFAKYQGMHPMTDYERETISSNYFLLLVYGKAKRFYDHPWYSLLSTATKGAGSFVLGLTLVVLLTDKGWLDALQSYQGYMVLLMARASGAPNGAHLLSYIPLPILGIYVAYKYRSNRPGSTYLGDVYQGILIVALGVAVHELIWMAAYEIVWGRFLDLATVSNGIEDAGFATMCLLFVYAFVKYPFRTIPLERFYPAILAYAVLIGLWCMIGLPITTINNWQIGHGTFGITSMWADPLTNAIEIWSWVQVSLSFFLVIWRS